MAIIKHPTITNSSTADRDTISKGPFKSTNQQNFLTTGLIYVAKLLIHSSSTIKVGRDVARILKRGFPRTVEH